MTSDHVLKFEELGEDPPAHPVEVNDSNFDSFVQKFPVAVIDCWAPWCGPCLMLSPTIHELAEQFQGRIAFGKVNTDESSQTAMKHRIMSIPTLLIFKNGQYADRIIGASPKQVLEKQLSEIL